MIVIIRYHHDIDHQSKSVWNGSRLSKEYSANAFHQYWNENFKLDNSIKNDEETKNKTVATNEILKAENPHELFNFMNTDSPILMNGIGILPEIQGEDYEELDFENRMRKKIKRNPNRFKK